MERLNIRGKIIHVTQLGDQKVEYLLAGLHPDLMDEIATAINQTSYVDKEHTEVIGNKLICKLKPTERLKFQSLIKRVAKVMVIRMEHYEKRTSKVKGTSRRDKKGNKGYQHRGAVAT